MEGFLGGIERMGWWEAAFMGCIGWDRDGIRGGLAGLVGFIYRYRYRLIIHTLNDWIGAVPFRVGVEASSKFSCASCHLVAAYYVCNL